MTESERRDLLLAMRVALREYAALDRYRTLERRPDLPIAARRVFGRRALAQDAVWQAAIDRMLAVCRRVERGESVRTECEHSAIA